MLLFCNKIQSARLVEYFFYFRSMQKVLRTHHFSNGSNKVIADYAIAVLVFLTFLRYLEIFRVQKGTWNCRIKGHLILQQKKKTSTLWLLQAHYPLMPWTEGNLQWLKHKYPRGTDTVFCVLTAKQKSKNDLV